MLDVVEMSVDIKDSSSRQRNRNVSEVEKCSPIFYSEHVTSDIPSMLHIPAQGFVVVIAFHEDFTTLERLDIFFVDFRIASNTNVSQVNQNVFRGEFRERVEDLFFVVLRSSNLGHFFGVVEMGVTDDPIFHLVFC
jgi:hypothetical protein